MNTLRKNTTIVIKIAAFTLLFFSVSYAQNELDAFRHSGMQLMGTARVQGLGGAYSAVGADFSGAFLNPAGLGIYRRSELAFTPHFRGIGSDAELADGAGAASRANLGVSNFAYVAHGNRTEFNTDARMTKNRETGFKEWGFGIGFNQVANFHRNTDVTGFNSQSSMTEYFANRANGTFVGSLIDGRSYEAQAFNAYMIDTVSGSVDTYFGAAQGGNVNQRYRAAESGRINEWSLAFGGNVNDKFYFGGALGIQNLKYTQVLEYLETDDQQVHQTWNGDSIPFEYMYLRDEYATTGSGVNLKAGIIVKATDFLRLGFSAQTPTWFGLKDGYSSSITGKVDTDSGELGGDTEQGYYTYNYRNPFKLTAGAMLLIKKAGFLTADVDLTDYTNSRFSSDVNLANPAYYDFVPENDAIRADFAPAVNLRVGGEARLGMMRLRAGYASYGSVLDETQLVRTDLVTAAQQKYSGKKQYLTGGFGYKAESFYLDIAFVRGMQQDNITLYSFYGESGVAPEVYRKNHSNNFILTTGFTF
jgi:hypothetical protein